MAYTKLGKSINGLLKDVADSTGITDVYEGTVHGDVNRVTAGFKTLSAGPAQYPDDPIRDKFAIANTSFSGVDTVAIAQINDKLLILGNVSTFSYSVYREKVPVRTLGRSQPKGYCHGGRTIGGSIVFVVFDRSPLSEIINQLDYDKNPTDRYSSPLADQIPPIDIILWFSNEYKNSSSLVRLYGVEFLQEGEVHSINDIYTENTMQYVARDMDVMINYEAISDFKNMLFQRQLSGNFTDHYLSSMLEYKNDLERRIGQADVIIQEAYQEMGRRNIVTLGFAAIGKTINADPRDSIRIQIKVKTGLLNELEKVNAQLIKYEQGMYGLNAHQNGQGIEATDNLKQSKVTR